MAYLVIGIITLFLTSFMIAYYGYIFRHTDHDVSFFLSVGIISVIMNLFTNMSAGAAVLSIVYLIVAVAFLGVGFAIDFGGTIAFYTSIGGWFKQTFADAANIGWKVLSFVLSPVGIVFFFIFYNSDHERACVCGKAGAWGLLIELLLVWMIVGLVSGIGSVGVAEAATALAGTL